MILCCSCVFIRECMWKGEPRWVTSWKTEVPTLAFSSATFKKVICHIPTLGYSPVNHSLSFHVTSAYHNLLIRALELYSCHSFHLISFPLHLLYSLTRLDHLLHRLISIQQYVVGVSFTSQFLNYYLQAIPASSSHLESCIWPLSGKLMGNH